MGTVQSLHPSDGGLEIVFTDSAPVLGDVAIGDSICVNGACLTATEFGSDWFRVGLANETLLRTNLGASTMVMLMSGSLKIGQKVNLERAMSSHTRFGGHMVQGHVDSTATISARVQDGDSIRYSFTLPTDTLLPYIVEKGYITIDGASLTLTFVNDKERSFGIALIPHSQEKVVLTGKQVGEKVNIEVDCVGKYILGSEARLEGIVERLVEKKLKERGLA
jgi:riboflavin synthase